MRLRELAVAVDAEIQGDADTEVTGVVHDSRQVSQGDLFCCVSGEVHDGHDFVPDALRRGAAALMVERAVSTDLAQIVVGDSRAAMAPAAAKFHGNPSHALDVIGVTGTNGKTTTVSLLSSILEHSGRRAAAIGTLTGRRTTPESPELQRLLRELVDSGHDVVAMEVSSHALAQHRVDAVRFRVAVFTNLSPEHLDFHGTMEEYFAVKARLFEPGRAEQMVVNLDDVHGRLLRDASGLPTAGYGLADAADIDIGPGGAAYTWRGRRVHLPLSGRFNIANALAASEVATLLGSDLGDIVEGLEAAGQVPGRFELVDEGQPFPVIVDYAHTPDGLEKLLEAAAELSRGGKVTVVFGCGGDRDRDKRPLMGEVAGRLADEVIVTNDNPRSEDPDEIIASITSGFAGDGSLVIIPDRRRAIDHAIRGAGAGDAVVIAGKGHETAQELSDRTVAFDDREVARRCLAERATATRGKADR